MSERKIHIFCGSGTGKTSAALGKGIREASAGKSVIVIQFLKEKNNETTADYFKRLEPEFRLFRFEKFPEDYESLTEKEREDECRNIKNGLNFARKVLVTAECDVLILDEILGLTDRGIVTVDELRTLIDAVGENTELYLTGTSRCEELWPYVDEVTEMTNPMLHTSGQENH
ncbi:MAG: cob(I)yrinic acid a,c-diamide adenosyltransferase [Lachnospiraceae bacterium]|nr:cob(I)yrinic acid a,c-diamide adenosyltransferase [Lachnospiraceae bacterium]